MKSSLNWKILLLIALALVSALLLALGCCGVTRVDAASPAPDGYPARTLIVRGLAQAEREVVAAAARAPRLNPG